MTDLFSWFKARKKPVIIEFRLVQPDETGVETLEGYKHCDPEKHYIIRGIKGEIYPIEKEIFYATYEVIH